MKFAEQQPDGGEGKSELKKTGILLGFCGEMVVRGVPVVGCFLLSASRVISFYLAVGMTLFFGTWWVSSYVALWTLPHFY